MKVKIINRSGFELPRYETDGAAAFDIRAMLPIDEFALYPRQQVNLGTGLHIELPQGTALMISGRSGNAMRYGISVTQGYGLIDSDYRGEIGIFITNHGGENFIIKHGDRIAQGMIVPVIQAEFEEVDELDETERGINGFGSTGK